jgi:hypothetical protein
VSAGPEQPHLEAPGIHPDAVAAAREHTDRRKAAVWAALAGIAQFAIVFFGHLAYPYVRDLLLGPGYLLLLPAVAHLHIRHAGVRISGATLALLTGAAAAIVGIAGALNVDAQPAAMFAQGMWWWTVGKLWAETGVVQRTFGMATAGGAALVLLASFVASGLAPLTALIPGVPDLALWDASRLGLAAWSLVLAAELWREPR